MNECARANGMVSRSNTPATTLRYVLWFVSLPVLMVLLAFWVSGVGQFRVPYDTIARLWLAPVNPQAAAGIDDTIRYIVIHVRLARICLALLVGAALSLAGVVYQGVLRNPLADPFTLGVSSGAAFAAALAILLGWGSLPFFGLSALPVVAFGGAMSALYLVYLLGRLDGRVHPTTLVLAGIIVSTFLSAWISLLKSLNQDSISTIVLWIMGSLSGKSWLHVMLLAPYVLVGLVAILFYARELDLFSLGDIQAQQLGVNVARTRFLLLLAASLMTAAAVSVSGVIGFVGLVVPHLVRLVLGPMHRRLLPASILIGGVLVLIADTLARSLLPRGEELPVGVVTAILGGPFFCFLLLRRKKTVGL